MIRKTHKDAILLLIAAMLVAVSACSSEESPITPSSEAERTFTVTAKVAREIYTRAHDESGNIIGGIYYLTYMPASGSSHYVASVDFAKEETTPGIGIVTIPDNQELKWANVGGGQTPTFYLDNVSREYAANNSTLTEIIFNEDAPYKAGIWDQDEGSNDLLWSELLAARNDKNINFNLHHNMSRVRVQVTVDRKYAVDPDDLDLEGAVVEISSINQVPISYNRLDGSLTLPTVDATGTAEDYNRVYTPLILVDERGTTAEANKINWATMPSAEEKEEANSILTYTTKDFVLPPQNLLEDEHRPRLTITLENGKTYSGILPHAMEIEDDNSDHTNPSYPVTLSFLKEHILTIRTVITEDPPELAFMPVQVVQWVDKGNFSIEAHQAGIYTAQEFENLIKYYNDNNEYQLVRYGRLIEDENRWMFEFFHSVELDYNEIAGKMKPDNDKKKDFSFSFNNYTIYINNGNNQEGVTSDQLYKIVTGTEQTP